MSDCGDRCGWSASVSVVPPRKLFAMDDGSGPVIDPTPPPGTGPGPEILDPTPPPAPAPATSGGWGFIGAAALAVVGLVASAVIGGTVGPFVGTVLLVAAVVLAVVEVAKDLADVGPGPAVQGIAKAAAAVLRGDLPAAAAALAEVPILSWVWLVVLALVALKYRGNRGKR